jgi:hypothetical protein
MVPLDAQGNYFAGDKIRTDAALASAARTATGTGTAFNTNQANSFEATLIVSAHSGTTPTLDVRLETSIDGGTSYDTVGSFVQFTTTDGTDGHVFGPLGDTCRWAWTIGGTTPSFTFAIAVEEDR